MVKNVMTGSYIFDDGIENKNIEFNFYTNLTAYDKAKFVKLVTNTLIDDDYNLILKDIIFDYTIIKVFTNVDLSAINESSNIVDAIEIFLENTNIVDIVKANVEEELIDELYDAVDANIEYRTGIHKNDLNNALTKLIHTIERKIDGIDLDGMMEMVQKFNGITDDFTTDNIVKAFTTTDAFKENDAKLKNSKKRRTKVVEEASNVISFADNK